MATRKDFILLRQQVISCRDILQECSTQLQLEDLENGIIDVHITRGAYSDFLAATIVLTTNGPTICLEYTDNDIALVGYWGDSKYRLHLNPANNNYFVSDKMFQHLVPEYSQVTE